MIDKQENIFIIVSYINILAHEYTGKEISPPITKLKKVCETHMRTITRARGGKWTKKTLKKGESVWLKCIDVFTSDTKEIDVYSTINALYTREWELLHQYARFNETLMTNYMLTSANLHTIEQEQAGDEVANKLIDLLYSE